MHYYVDGYNLLFRCLYTHQKLSKERQKLLESLNAQAEYLHISITLVFDGCYPENTPSRGHYKHLEVLFTGEGETADALIIECIQRTKTPEKITVVTSDRRLASQARQCRANTQATEEFLNFLNKREQNKRRKKHQNRDVSEKIALKKSPPSLNTPSPHASITECFYYYLESFQKPPEEIEKNTL
jgi:predicted RNA-binding protein with PIN domain